jgi:HPt (histidine-containing phosphotransfer) domain-containing protein
VNRRDAAVFDRAAALQRCGDDLAFFHDLVRVFLTDCPEQMKALSAALSAGDAATLAQTADRLKGAAANFAAPGVVTAALQLEQRANAGDLAGGPAALATLEAEVGRLVAALRKEVGAS